MTPYQTARRHMVEMRRGLIAARRNPHAPAACLFGGASSFVRWHAEALMEALEERNKAGLTLLTPFMFHIP